MKDSTSKIIEIKNLNDPSWNQFWQLSANDSSFQYEKNLLEHFFPKKGQNIALVLLDKNEQPRARALFQINIDQESIYIGFLKSLSADDCTTLIKYCEKLAHTFSSKIKTIYAPFNFTTWFSYRTKLSSTDNQYWWEPTYDEQLTKSLLDCSWCIDQTYFSAKYKELQESFDRHKKSYDKLKNEFDFQTLDQYKTTDLASIIYNLNINSFNQAAHYYPITIDEYKKFIFSKIPVSHFKTSIIVLKNSEPQGYGYCFEEKDSLVIKSMLLSPSSQSIGLGSALSFKIAELALNQNLTSFTGAMVRDDNKSRFLFSHFGPGIERHEYAIYKFLI